MGTIKSFLKNLFGKCTLCSLAKMYSDDKVEFLARVQMIFFEGASPSANLLNGSARPNQ